LSKIKQSIHHVSLYGVGHFGFSLLHYVCKLNKTSSVAVYDRNPLVRSSLAKQGRHPFLHQSVVIEHPITVCDSPNSIPPETDLLILAVTADALREVLCGLDPRLTHRVLLVNTAKALDPGTGKRLSEIVETVIPNSSNRYYQVSGGTSSKDFLKGFPLGATIAGSGKTGLSQLLSYFDGGHLRLFPSDDIVGVEYAGAFKNILSFLSGLLQALKYPHGTETYFISIAAGEVESLVTTELGGNPNTFRVSSQCWGNDMWMSCTGDTRNRRLGNLVAQGHSPQEAVNNMLVSNQSVESASTLVALQNIPTIKHYPILNFLKELFSGEASLESLDTVLNFLHQESSY